MSSPISRSFRASLSILFSARGRALPHIFVCLLIGISFGACQAGGKGAGGGLAPSVEQAEGEALFGGPAATRRGDPSREAWTIVVYGYRGEERGPAAREALDWITRNTGLTGFRPEERGEATVIAYGHYTDPRSERALGDLARLKAVDVDGAHPFEDAVITPPAYVGLGQHPEYDLRRARENFPGGVYTLQVGFYGVPGKLLSELPPKDQEEIRGAGEQAAVNLRREGELAFYYHGPTGTTVTVGVFSDADIDLTKQYESLEVRALRERFPHNLVNGKELRQRMRRSRSDREGVWMTQSSRPVAIP
jgi:hypothetical protein